MPLSEFHPEHFEDLAGCLARGTTGRSPLHRQLYQWLRQSILDGALPPGMRLPPGRLFASRLGVSRNTIHTAFDQLLAEGFIEGRPGSGVFVADFRPAGKVESITGADTPQTSTRLSRRGQTVSQIPVTRIRSVATGRPFAPGVPGLDHFPYDQLARLQAKIYRELEAAPHRFGYGEAQGLPELREAVAAHLRIERGVQCEAQQVLIVNGSQEALYLCGRLLLDPDDIAFVEDPGYLGARGAFRSAGVRIVGVPVEAVNGISVTALRKSMQREKAKGRGRALIYTTPTHQFPLGMPMPLARRLDLLEFARESGTLIIEDDYDSDYRYTGRPISALQGLDADGENVVYIGTFSKILAPGLRLGSSVLPAALVSAFATARALIDRQPPFVVQAMVARFLRDGALHRHLRRMRELYAERRTALLHGVEEYFRGGLVPMSTDSGLHVTHQATPEIMANTIKKLEKYPGQLFDQKLSAAAAALSVDLVPLSTYYLNPGAPGNLQGFLFGFAGYNPADMSAAFAKLKRIIF